MKTILRSHHPVRHVKSFKYAFEGIFHTLVNEPNFRVQIIIVLGAVYIGFKYNITNIEWAILTISMGWLLAAEMINTVVEEFIDALIKEYHEGAKIIKDVSAGFVLITAITALFVLYLIFADRILGSIV